MPATVARETRNLRCGSSLARSRLASLLRSSSRWKIQPAPASRVPLQKRRSSPCIQAAVVRRPLLSIFIAYSLGSHTYSSFSNPRFLPTSQAKSSGPNQIPCHSPIKLLNPDRHLQTIKRILHHIVPIHLIAPPHHDVGIGLLRGSEEQEFDSRG